MSLPFARAAIVWVVALQLASRQAAAQSTDASIAGTVRDSAGAPLAGVAVALRNAETGFETAGTTDARGRFGFVQLPLGGPYRITARRLGYRPAARDGYRLTMGARVELELRLAPSPLRLDPVVVRDEGGARESRDARGGGNTLIDAARIAAVPAVGRNFTDLVSLAPTAGAQGALLGQRWTATDYRLDGLQSRNATRAGEYGAGPFTVSLEAIREFEVDASVYDVTQGRQGGGAVRAATKFGTNDFTGSAFAFQRGSALSAAEDFQGVPREARRFSATQWGGSVGGPIVRDRLHYFVAFDRQDSREPLFVGRLRSAADEVAAGIARDSLARLLDVLGRVYGLADAGAQTGELRRAPVANTVFARLDWQLGVRHHATLRHDFSDWRSPLSGGVDQPITLREARSDFRSAEHQSLLSLRSALGAVQNELRLGVSSSTRRLTPVSDLPRGFVRVQSRLPGGTLGDTRVQFGGNRLAPDDSREAQLQVADVASVRRGGVLYTVGTDNSLARLRTYIAESQSGLFEFESIADLEARRASRYSRSVPLLETAPTTRQRVLEVGAFAQGEWRPAARLTATIGVRWDGTAFLDAAARNPAVERTLGLRTDRRPSDWGKWQPRGQLVWDVGGDGKTVARIGGGRFAAQLPYYLQHNQLLNDGRRVADIVRTGAAVPTPDYAAYRNDPSTIPGLPPGAAPPPAFVNVVARDFRTPGTWKGSLSLRRDVAPWLTVTGTLSGSRTTDGYFYVDRNLRDGPAFTLDNEAGRGVFVPAATIDARGRTLNRNAWKTTEVGRVMQLVADGKASQRSAIAEGTVRLPRGAQLDASYTYNRARDNTSYGCCLARTATTFTPVRSDPRDLSGSWGAPDVDFRHKVVVAGTLPPVAGFRLSGRYVGSSGRPFSLVVNGDINGDEATSNDLAFLFDPDDPATPSDVAAAMRRVLANPKNVAREYMRGHLGQIAGRNTVHAPWAGRVDVRLARTVPSVRGQRAELTLDVFNFANLLNPRWGSQLLLPVGISNQNPVVQRIPLLNVVGFDQTTRRYRYTVNENAGVLRRGGDPYQMQLGVRYAF